MGNCLSTEKGVKCSTPTLPGRSYCAAHTGLAVVAARAIGDCISGLRLPIDVAKAFMATMSDRDARAAFTYLRAVCSEGAGLLGDVQAPATDPAAAPRVVRSDRCAGCIAGTCAGHRPPPLRLTPPAQKVDAAERRRCVCGVAMVPHHDGPCERSGDESACATCGRPIALCDIMQHVGGAWRHIEGGCPDAPVEPGRVCAARHARALALGVADIAAECVGGCGALAGEGCK